MEHARCPRCGTDTTVVGWSDTSDQHRSFQPDGIHWLRHLLMHLGETTQIHLPDRYRACLECGLIWNSLPPEQLRTVLSGESVAIGDVWAAPLID